MSLLYAVRELREADSTDEVNKLLASGNGWMLMEIVFSSGAFRYILGRVSDPRLLARGTCSERRGADPK